MQLKKSRFRSLFCSALFAVALAGCGPRPAAPEVSAPQRSGGELNVACPNETAAAILRGRGQAWALRNGVKITVQLYDPAKDTEPPGDVWIISAADLPRWADADRLVPLPDVYKTPDNPLAWSDLLPAFREQLLQWDGKTYGLPLIGEAPVCCYRRDQLQSPALRSLLGRNADGPANWEQFALIAEHFREKNPNGQSIPSLPPLPKADADLDRLFYTVAAGFARRAVRDDEDRRAYHANDLFSFHYDYETGQPRIASNGFVQALKLLQRLQKCRPAHLVEQPEETFREGHAILCLTDAPWIVQFQKTDKLRDKIGVSRVPGGDRYFDFGTDQVHKPAGAANGMPYLGGASWLAVVPRSARTSETAFALLADLAASKTSTQIFLGSTSKGGPTRTSQLYRHRWDTFDLDDKQAVHLRDILDETLLHRNLKNPVLCLRTPRQVAHRAALVRGLREALLEGADAEKTLRGVAEAWKKLDAEQGMKEHKADYRRSLGLLAKE